MADVVALTRPTGQAAPDIQPVNGRLALAATDRLTLASTARIFIDNINDPEMDANIDYTPAIQGVPVASKVSFVILDGWQLPIYDRLTLQGLVRATIKGVGRLIVTDFNMPSRIVLQGSMAGR